MKITVLSGDIYLDWSELAFAQHTILFVCDLFFFSSWSESIVCEMLWHAGPAYTLHSNSNTSHPLPTMFDLVHTGTRNLLQNRVGPTLDGAHFISDSFIFYPPTSFALPFRCVVSNCFSHDLVWFGVSSIFAISFPIWPGSHATKSLLIIAYAIDICTSNMNAFAPLSLCLPLFRIY